MVRSAIDAKTCNAAKSQTGPRYCNVIVYARALAGFVAGLLLLLSLAPSPALAETRRAFVVGIQRYSDGYIQRLERAANDAKDLAKDLEEVGFDKKNIKLAVDLNNRDAFEKEFTAFLNTIEAGDDVVFYFSGHGFGVEADQTNYLLFADLKSPFTYTKSQLTDQERKNADVVRLKIPAISRRLPEERNSQRRFGKRNRNAGSRRRIPKTVIMILDACRSLVQNESRVAGNQVRQARQRIRAAGC